MKRINSHATFRTAISCALALTVSSFAYSDYYVSSGPLATNGKICRFADDGTPKGEFGSSGLRLPIGIMFAEEDVLLVADFGNQEVHAYHADGTDLGVFITNIDPITMLIDTYGNLLIADYTGQRIRRFTLGGIDLGDFAATGLLRHGQLAMDAIGNIYVASFLEQTIQHYDPDGNYLGVYSDNSISGITSAVGLAFQTDGSLLVSETFGDTLTQLDSAGNYLSLFANTGMEHPEMISLEPNGDVLLPSWQSGTVRRYDGVGNDLGDFVSVPNCYEILHGPEIVAPNDMRVLRGRLSSGDINSLADDDGSSLKLCKALVANIFEPAIQLEVTGTTSILNPSAVSVAVTSRMASGGTYTQQIIMVDKNDVQSPTVRRTDPINVVEMIQRLVATGDPTDFVNPDGRVRIRVNIKAVGLTAVPAWCQDTDRVAWTVRP